MKRFLAFLRSLRVKVFGLTPISLSQPSPPESAPTHAAPVPSRTRETTRAELDPLGITTARRGHFDPRWNMCPATQHERQMRELEAASRRRPLN
jgi:hypothetical protein